MPVIVGVVLISVNCWYRRDALSRSLPESRESKVSSLIPFDTLLGDGDSVRCGESSIYIVSGARLMAVGASGRVNGVLTYKVTQYTLWERIHLAS